MSSADAAGIGATLFVDPIVGQVRAEVRCSTQRVLERGPAATAVHLPGYGIANERAASTAAGDGVDFPRQLIVQIKVHSHVHSLAHSLSGPILSIRRRCPERDGRALMNHVGTGRFTGLPLLHKS